MTEAPGTADKLRVEAGTIRIFLQHWRGSLIGVALLAIGAMVVWREHIGPGARAAWLGLALVNDLAQAAVCLQLERAPVLDDALARWRRWLLLSIAVAAGAWGLLPWMLADAPPSVMLLAGMVDAMLMFCVAHAPGTPAMLVSAWVPCALLASSALLATPAVRLPGLAVAAMFIAVVVYGLRLQRAIGVTVYERQRATDLADALARQQARLIELEHERTLLVERERLMRDMHDGLGSTLASSLAAAERSALSPREMAQALRECVDDLRTVIDSLETYDHDVVALLATLRFRHGARLAAAGVRLEWSMYDVLPLPWLQPPEALQLMRAMQEALGNVVRHAAPCRLQVAATHDGDAVVIRVADDGPGFDPGQASGGRGRGLGHLRQRIEQRLGGTLAVHSAPGQGTTLLLRLPLQQQALRP